jgi:hypothetical protein
MRHFLSSRHKQIFFIIHYSHLDNKLINFTGCQGVDGKDINDFSPFNNIGDIVSAMFKSGQVYTIDDSNCDSDIVIEEL